MQASQGKYTKRNRITNPWITNALINSISKRDRLYKKWKQSKSKLCTSGDPRLYEECRLYRNRLSNLVKLSKRKYYNKKFENATGNLKQTWTLINELRGKCRSTIPPYMTINDIVTDKRTIATEFNKYFSSLARNLNNSTIAGKDKVPTFDRYLPKSEPSSLFLEDTNSDEVIDIIKEFKMDKSSDIPIIVVKHCVPVIAHTLSKLYNKCIHAGTFPSILKHGRITSVFRKGRKDDINNYRHISTLTIFGKIFEKILYKRIYSFLISKNIISDTQFGFRMNHSTSHAIHHSVSFIKKSHANKKHVIGIFIDLSKAFDTIDHKTLLRKLYNHGLRGSTQDQISDYLCNRYQRVKIHEE